MGSLQLEKNRKRKKKKMEEEEEEGPKSGDAQPEAATRVGLAEEQKKNKKHKKKKKNQPPEVEISKEADGEAGADALNGVVQTAAHVDKKKKKKKEKKQEKREAEEAKPAVEVQNGESGAEPKTKKSKKSGGDGEMGVGEMGAVASVASGGLTVSVFGSGCDNPIFKPLTSFSVPGVPENVLACCRKFDRPSPIQAYAWPFLLAGKDLIGIARTGSGKTLAFGIPAMVHVLKKLKTGRPCPLALVLAPTRELTQQIAEVLEEAGGGCGVKVACIYGGAAKGPQKAILKAGATIVVATPGRLQDLVEEGVCSLDLVSFLVLDEADRMLDLGFEPAIRAIISLTHKNRQTLMFSATWPASVHKLSKEFMQDSGKIIKVTVGSEDLAANHDVTQIVEVVEDRDRVRLLEALLQKFHKSRLNRVLVFVLYKKEAARVESLLQQRCADNSAWEYVPATEGLGYEVVGRGWLVAAIHGDKGQSDRNRAVQLFKDGVCPLLVATDVAARGLDIPDVEYVINFSFPLTVEDYVHRIGRTGRAGKKGIAHTFFTQADKARAGELVNVLKEAGQNIPESLLKFGTHVKKKESALYGAHFKEIGATAKQATKITFDASDEE